MVNSVRTLTQGEKAEIFLGHEAGYWVSRSLLWAVGLNLVFGVLSTMRFRKG